MSRNRLSPLRVVPHHSSLRNVGSAIRRRTPFPTATIKCRLPGTNARAQEMPQRQNASKFQRHIRSDSARTKVAPGRLTPRLGEGRADDTTRSDAGGRARRRGPRSWRITSSLRTTRSLTGTLDRRLDVDVGLRVCAERAWVGVPRRFKAIVFVTAPAREATVACRDGFGDGHVRRVRGICGYVTRS
jgi:hypothetical protein